MRKFLFLCSKLFVLIALLGVSVLGYLVYYYSKDLPDYSQLADYHPPSVTRIYSLDGKLIEEYAYEHRVFVPISSIPRSLIEAFVAAEDKNFFKHPGVDIISILRAAVANITNVLNHRRMEGGSTITQQVVKNFLLTSERSLGRKIKEAILSYRISQVFTKEQILELYLNQTFFGRGYGVAIAAQNYFNKSVDELTLAESAYIAGLPKAPSTYDPQKNYKKAKERRDYVITRMLEDGYITQEAATEALNSPIVLGKRDRSDTVTAGYYAEQVREELIKMFGKDQFYTAGLTVITSMDSKMQKFSQNSLRKGIRDYDKRKGYKGPIAKITLDKWQEKLWGIAMPEPLLEYELAVVLDVTDTQAQIGLANGATAKIPLTEMKWAKANLKSAKELLAKGNVIVVEQLDGKATSKNALYGLRQVPKINGAIMVMNPTTGQVLAMQGGYDFDTSKFNRATQALRQPGSLSKTFIYLAALENDVQPNKIFEDAPTAISQGPGMPLWRPKNYKGDFLGSITMRTGLEKSRNLITVRVAQTIGLSKVAEIIKRFGINNDPKKMYSMVLGSLETTLEKMTTAYAIIANSGQKVTPHFIEMVKDRNGKIIYRRDSRECKQCPVSDEGLASAAAPEVPESQQRMITDPASSYQITSFLTGVTTRGTAASAKKLGKVIAGKTGTTNESKDTWFIGFTPRIVVGTYIGYDTPKDMGARETGSSVALPIFMDFMEHAYKDTQSLEFKVPDSIKLVSLDPKSGTPSKASNAIMEAFKLHSTTPSYNENGVESPPSGNHNDTDSNSSRDVFHSLEPDNDVDIPDQSEEIY